MVRKPSQKPAKGAASGARGRSRSARAAAPGDDGPARVISAALDLAVAKGWHRVCLAGVAAASGLSLAEMYAVFPSKAAILDGFLRQIDARVLAGGDTDADESIRDRLFEVVMRRFDALNPHKAAVAAITRDCLDPTVCVVGVPGLLRSMAWMLEAAGLSSAGVIGLMRAKGLALICLNALRVWLRDDSADMAKTMTAVDKGLRQAESLVGMVCVGRRSATDDRATQTD